MGAVFYLLRVINIHINQYTYINIHIIYIQINIHINTYKYILLFIFTCGHLLGGELIRQRNNRIKLLYLITQSLALTFKYGEI